MNPPTAIIWYRNDLRLRDHLALNAAVDEGHNLLCLYVIEPQGKAARARGGASKWWLHYALKDLRKTLIAHGGDLHVVEGDAIDVLPAVAKAHGNATVFGHYKYQRATRERDDALATQLTKIGSELKLYHGYLLRDPETLRKASGDYFRVYTPFWRAAGELPPPPHPVDPPQKIRFFEKFTRPQSVTASHEDTLLELKPDWASGLRDAWDVSEDAANEHLKKFCAHAIGQYSHLRNVPSQNATSRLSPYLHFGQISPRQVWYACDAVKHKSTKRYLMEVMWREFAWYSLYHAPALVERDLNPSFSKITWREDLHQKKAWQRGKTGIPIVDAGMRELWYTGWMHNRVRMIVGSFLTKHLLLHWREGEAWFWDTLVDADPAANATNWQWVAGTGIESAPFFRIFNPVLQGRKFDGDGNYVRRWVPELTKLGDKYLHAPWEAPPASLKDAGIVLGETYPKPLIDLREGRARALEAFEKTKTS